MEVQSIGDKIGSSVARLPMTPELRYESDLRIVAARKPLLIHPDNSSGDKTMLVRFELLRQGVYHESKVIRRGL